MKKDISYQPIEGLTYDVAGLFTHTKILLQLIDCIEARLGYKIPIASIYGAEKTSWNGGRYTYNQEISSWKEELLILAERNIIPIFTFTNLSINHDMLGDKRGNELLTFVTKHNIKCEVRVVSDILKKYIRENYPTIKINASIITVTSDKGMGNLIYYDQLSQNYNKYVVHPDDNFDYKLLEQINKKNAEILLNERCSYKCINRLDHYLAIDTLTRTGDKEPHNNLITTCIAKQFNSKERNISLSITEMNLLISLGFRQFKIQGRVDNLYAYIYDIIRYTLREEHLISQIYIQFCDIIKNYNR